jgi:hypothetical protein
MAPSADMGLIGLAVMGQNLILNVGDHGFTICAFNRTVSKVDRFLENEAKGLRFSPGIVSFPSEVADCSAKIIKTSLALTPSRNSLRSSRSLAVSCCSSWPASLLMTS